MSSTESVTTTTTTTTDVSPVPPLGITSTGMGSTPIMSTGIPTNMAPINIGGLLCLVKEFSGERQFPVKEFFAKIDYAASLGSWPECHKLMITRTNLKGNARDYVEAEEVLNHCSYEELRTALVNRFHDEDKGLHSSQSFLECVQRTGEEVMQYATRLQLHGRQTLTITSCEGENQVRRKVLQESLLQQFVRGLKSNLKRLILSMSPDTYENAVKMAVAEERNDELMHGKKHQVGTVENAVQGVERNSADARGRAPRQEIRDLSYVECYRCGRQGHFANNCGGAGSNQGSLGPCFACGKQGHFARECHQQPCKPRLYQVHTNRALTVFMKVGLPISILLLMKVYNKED